MLQRLSEFVDGGLAEPGDQLVAPRLHGLHVAQPMAPLSRWDRAHGPLSMVEVVVVARIFMAAPVAATPSKLDFIPKKAKFSTT